MDKKNVIEMLNHDLQEEHGAIIQYLTHAFSMGEGELACEIEAVSRDEMRHLDWLAETIVGLGGKPSLKRGTMRMLGKTPPDWMKDNVFLEEGAIKLYRQHIRRIDDPKINRLLERIISDEASHRKTFSHFIDKTREEGVTDRRGARKDNLAQTLNKGMGQEYTAILQFLFHSYMAKNARAKQQLEDQAINEMQHLGWMGEELVDAGGTPVVELGKVDVSTRAPAMLKADIDMAEKIAAIYRGGAKDKPGAEATELFRRMLDNHKYQIEVFKDVLGDVSAGTRKRAAPGADEPEVYTP